VLPTGDDAPAAVRAPAAVADRNGGKRKWLRGSRLRYCASVLGALRLDVSHPRRRHVRRAPGPATSQTEMRAVRWVSPVLLEVRRIDVLLGAVWAEEEHGDGVGNLRGVRLGFRIRLVPALITDK
jgi:hypothetical protein